MRNTRFGASLIRHKSNRPRAQPNDLLRSQLRRSTTMGIKNIGPCQFAGPPKDLMLWMKRTFNVDLFIECGTFTGDTAVWAGENFKKVVTIEPQESIYRTTKARHVDKHNIEFRWGDSRALLGPILASQESPAIFWLDSHWSGGETFGEGDECPLLAEIAIINESLRDHYLFIDDARLFMRPPPLPHQLAQWPSIADVVKALSANPPRYHVVIMEDVIVAVPYHQREPLAVHLQELISRHWAIQMKEIALTDREKALCQLRGGLSLAARLLIRRLGRIAGLRPRK